jgi:DNA helicase II / ATP-dependent DNA helicase PcrA
MAALQPDEDFERAIQPLLAAQGPVIVSGSAGSGKTTVALRKASLAINEGLASRHARVLFLSFANATVDRVADHATSQLTKEQRSRLEVGTYHSFAWTILRSHGYLLGAPRSVRIMSQAEQNAFSSRLLGSDADMKAEFRRQFETFGHVGFNEFAGIANEILSGNPSLLAAYTSAYPLIVLDEFQDTTDDQWALVRTLGEHSQLIALGDPDQRIYDFVEGSSETRFADFEAAFAPVQVDLSAWNWRSPGSSITRFGRDSLRGRFEPPYEEVDVLFSDFPTLLRLKLTLLEALKRVRESGGGTIAILTPTNALAVRVYDYISAPQTNPTLPALGIDIHTTKEEGYAALIFIGAMLQIRQDDAYRDATVCDAMAHYMRTKSTKLSATARDTANRLEGYATKVRAGAHVEVKIVKALRAVVDGSMTYARTGHVYADYLAVVSLVAAAGVPEITAMAGYVRMLNLVTRGSALETSLASSWRANGSYVGASEIVREAVLQFQLTSSKRGSRDLIVMTVHRAKGREFDEIIVYEERYAPLLNLKPTLRDVESARYALNVAVTRAKKRATVITPLNAPSPLLTLKLNHVTTD